MADCQSMYQHAAELWKKYGTMAKAGVAATGPQGASVAAAIEISEQLGKEWNKLVGNSSDGRWVKRRMENAVVARPVV